MIASSLKEDEGVEILKLLIHKGADVNMKSNTGQVGCSSGRVLGSIVRLTTVAYPQNALHFAASKANMTTVKILLDHGCSARIRDKRGQLPLHRAAAVGSTPIVKKLLGDGKSPIDAADIDGLTALHHAISEGHGDTAIVLMEAGADLEKRDADGNVAIDLAPDTKVNTLRLFVESSDRI